MLITLNSNPVDEVIVPCVSRCQSVHLRAAFMRVRARGHTCMVVFVSKQAVIVPRVGAYQLSTAMLSGPRVAPGLW